MEAFEHIYNKLIALGESHVYINSYNEDYDNISVINYYGTINKTDIAFGYEVIARHPVFQIYVRDTSFATGYGRIDTIRAALAVYSYQKITITQKSDILFLGNDENKRAMLTCNFNMMLLGGSTVT